MCVGGRGGGLEEVKRRTNKTNKQTTKNKTKPTNKQTPPPPPPSPTPPPPTNWCFFNRPLAQRCQECRLSLPRWELVPFVGGSVDKGKLTVLFESLWLWELLIVFLTLTIWERLYWAIQAGLLTPLTFARHRLSPLAAFTSGAYFLHNGRR